MSLTNGANMESDLKYRHSNLGTDHPGDDALTLAAIGTVAYILCDLLHELAGHGGVCIATGGRAATLSSFHFQCFGGWQPLICAAGILLNLTAGILLWLVLRRTRHAAAHTRFFLWLGMAYSLFTGWGYVVSSSITNLGDWANALRGLPAVWHWRVGIAILGMGFYALSVWITAIEMRPFIGSSGPSHAWRLILIPYFAAALAACGAAAFNAIMPREQALISAISTTFGAWGFLFLPLCLRLGGKHHTNLESLLGITRNRGWILTAGVLTIIFIVALGHGVKF